ncbi:3-phosphoshikimate 1-carboxyvinyltransferase [Denitratimonas tolerans]|uniref:3-phosphoshikimate 1-carboxyvinyltransferase n=1 Tax=Denitratimonas tolerans TaxID=1338420 RepID=A0AAW9R562_9GAMM|nr:3-phosphoshikimate 1-carboxyvinyltransferase [Chiayiivirga sp.]
MTASSTWQARPGTPLRGTIRVPGDKSISHRAMMLGALADGVTRVSGFLEGEDTLATAAAFRAMGVRIEDDGPGRKIVHGAGIDGLRAPAAPIDCGNAGTGMRLLAGLLAGQRFDSTLTGDASLTRRPMRRVTEPLARMGARIETAEGGRPPLRIFGGQSLAGVDHDLPVASAQVKSALLLAGLYAQGETTVREPHPTRDYTERMLAALGWPIEFSPGFARLSGGHRLTATDIAVPSDFSSAAFFLVAASLVPGSDLTLEGVGMNPRRTGLLDALRLMGAWIEVRNAREEGGEPVADLRVTHAPLHGAIIPEALVPDMIDEFPVLFVAAAAVSGVTTVSGAAELRVKESDRIAVMANGLRAMGARIDETPDGAVIHGGATLGGASVDAHDDHRIAMSFVVAGQIASAPVTLRGCATVATSFPGFFGLANRAGMGLAVA